MATKKKSEPTRTYRRESRDGRYVYVYRVSTGGEVYKQRNEYHAYDAAGHFLGWSNDADEANFMAVNGFTNRTNRDEANELGLWLLWNDAKDAGTEFLLSENGVQVLALPGQIFMLAEDSKTGFGVELIDEIELERRYGKTGGFDCVHKLKVIDASQAYRLE